MSRRAINRTVRNIRRAATMQRLAAMQENQRRLTTLFDALDDSASEQDLLDECREAGEDPVEVATRTRARLEAAPREYRAKTHDDPKPR